MLRLTTHLLVKKTELGCWICENCQLTWGSKPKSVCPGVTAYPEIPKDLMTQSNLDKQNLVAIADPVGAVYFKSRNTWVALYDPKETVILDDDLPPIYTYEERGELKFKWELRKLNLIANETTKISGVVAWWNKEDEMYDWMPLYNPDDCEWKAQDNYLTKTTLKKKYLLSEGWIKKLGEPDKIKTNPHYENGSPMLLFSRQRIEQYLADNAEKYAKWLDRRDKLVDHYNKFKDRIESKRKQKNLCNNCQRGINFDTDKGKQFLCVVYPTGLEKIPCPDFLPNNADRH